MKHLILFSVESLRADVFEGAWHAPHLNRFAAESAVFTRCHTTGVNTVVAHGSLMTGRYPHENGIRHAFPANLNDQSKTLAEMLGENGFYSVSSVAFTNDFLTSGLFRGFSEKIPSRTKALKQIARARIQGKRTFLWIQSGALHRKKIRSKNEPFLSYEERILRFDREFKQLWSDIQREKLDLDTLIVLVGAHGEGVSRERGLGHGRSLDEGAIRVPLVLRGPLVTPKRPVTPASIRDVAPTCLSLLGLKPNHKSVPGADLTRPSSQAKISYAELWDYDLLYWKLLGMGIFTRPREVNSSWQGSWAKLQQLFRLGQQTLLNDRYKWTIRYGHGQKKTTETLCDLLMDPGEYRNLLVRGTPRLPEYRKIAIMFSKQAKDFKKQNKKCLFEAEKHLRLFLPLHAQDGLVDCNAGS